MPTATPDSAMCAAATCSLSADCLRHADCGRTPARGQPWLDPEAVDPDAETRCPAFIVATPSAWAQLADG